MASDSDSALPEIISFSSSASLAKGHDHSLRSFHAVEKQKIKERNKQHDERLKAQANTRRRVTATTRKGKLYVGDHEVETGDSGSGSESDHHLHWRMTRAMGDAEEETDSASAEEWEGINATSGDDLPTAADRDVEMSESEGADETEGKSRNGDLDSDEGESDDDGLGVLRSQAPPSKYLPDHVFVAAWPKSKPENEMRLSQTTLKTQSSRKRRPVRARKTDVIVGWVSVSHSGNIFRSFRSMNLIPSPSSRTVRTLLSSPASVHVQSQGATLRPARIDKFLANALRLEGKSKKISPRASRWERRPCTSCIFPAECSSLTRSRAIIKHT